MNYSEEMSHSHVPFMKAQFFPLIFGRVTNIFQPFPCPLVHKKSLIRLNPEIIFGIYVWDFFNTLKMFHVFMCFRTKLCQHGNSA